MLTEVFYWLLNMSILGGLCCIPVLILRRIGKIPKTFVFWLWVIPLIRLILPFGLTNPYSLMTLISKFTTRTVVIFERSGWEAKLAYANTIMAADSYFPLTFKAGLWEKVFGTAAMIWIVVAAAALLCAVLMYHFTRTEIKGAVHVKENIYRSGCVASAALYGICRPKIILPVSIGGPEQDYVILHEKMHLKRHDNLWRCVAVLTCCIHWFNPVCWLSLKYFFEDMELSCDSRVLQGLDGQGKKEYAYAILNASASKNLFAAGFGGARVRVRLENILSYRRLTAVSALAFALLTIAVILMLVTNAAV